VGEYVAASTYTPDRPLSHTTARAGVLRWGHAAGALAGRRLEFILPCACDHRPELLRHSMSDQPIRILFVCLGNICRSPLAEAVFRTEAERRGVADRFEVDSAGTSGYHRGAAPDRRAATVARTRGINVTGASRQITSGDLELFDYVVCMDTDNLDEVERLRAQADASANVARLRDWDPEPEHGDVPDPYFGGDQGFEIVHDIVERACRAMLDDILRTHA
jgi:protein-tyrosine phosphatase